MCKIFFTSFYVLFIVVNAFANVIPEPGEEECQSSNQPESRFLYITETMDVIESCLWKKLNLPGIENEVILAKTEGNLSEVIKRTCQKQPTFYECVENRLTQVLEGNCAYTEQEISQQQSILGLVRKLMDFACFNDGAVVTEFLTANGEDCLAENTGAMSKCVSAAYHNYSYVMNRLKVEEYCQDLTNFTKCIMPLFQKCKSSIPIRGGVESFMKVVLEDFKCDSNIFTEIESKVDDNVEQTTQTIAMNEI